MKKGTKKPLQSAPNENSAPRLGAHVSVAGGLEKAFPRAEELGCEAIQIFVKSQHRWQAKPLDDARREAFVAVRPESSVSYVTAHASYLINLAATDPEILAKSHRALADELLRCARLGLDGLVLHPGAHLGDGEEVGIERISWSLDTVLGDLAGAGELAGKAEGTLPKLLLENTAGQGTVLGYQFEQLAAMIEGCDHREALGVCLDTCHAFAAGYPIHEPKGVAEMLDRFEETVGLEALACFHVNDSKQPFASRKDRHENLGQGEIGESAFEQLMNEPRLAGMPLLLETPAGSENEGYKKDLALLRSFL